MNWDAANARARGLATHLLDRESLLLAAEADSWQAAAQALVERGYPVGEGGARLTPQELDRATGRVLADRLALLGRWLGEESGMLAVLSEEAEYRALRRLLRGAAQGASPGARLQGTTPTRGLTERGLEVLARAESPGQLTAALIRLGHPAGRALTAAAADAKGPELWRLEVALGRMFVLRTARSARHAGRAVRRLVSVLIDLLNVESLLLAGEWNAAASADEVFLPGGQVLDRARFATAARLGTERIEAVLSDWLARTPLGPLFGGSSAGQSFEARALGALLAWQRRESRRDPLGPGVVLEVIGRMRAEAHDVRLVSSALALAAPAAVVAAALVTPR